MVFTFFSRGPIQYPAILPDRLPFSGNPCWIGGAYMPHIHNAVCSIKRYLSLPLAMLLVGLLTVSCAPDEPIKLGFVGGLSGRVADLGISGRDGATLAIEQKNAAGGIRGRKIKLIAVDDKQDPARPRLR